MKIIVLVDNTDGSDVKGEWGLSFYIWYGNKVVLLDAGYSDLFAQNADKLGLDLAKVDFAVLSHIYSQKSVEKTHRMYHLTAPITNQLTA